MYLRELFLNLDEGKEDFLANRDGEKLLAAVDYKNDQKFDDALALVNHFSSAVGPKYLQWLCRVYIKDEHFKVEDLPDLSQTLKDYENLKRLGAISPNIDSFKTVGELNQEVSKHSKDASDKSDIFRYKQAMREMAEAGEAELKELGGVLFYYPHSWEACKSLREANPDDMKLCVTYLDTSEYYDQYTAQGELNFFIVDQKLYLFYFNTSDLDDEDETFVPNEFANASNVHIDPATLYKKHTAILREYYEYFGKDAGFILNDPAVPDEEKIKIIEKNIRNISLLSDNRDPLLEKIIEIVPHAIVYRKDAPDSLRMMALKKDPGIIGDYYFTPTAEEITVFFDYILKNPKVAKSDTLNQFTEKQLEQFLLVYPAATRQVVSSKFTKQLIVKLMNAVDPSDPSAEFVGNLIRLVKNPSTELINRAITLDPRSIRNIENPTEDMKRLALKSSNGTLESYFKEMDKETLRVALSYGTGFDKITPDNTDNSIMKYAIDQHLRYRPNYPMSFIQRVKPSPVIQYYILKHAPDAIGFIKDIDPKLQKRFQTLAPITTASKFEYGEYSPENQIALLKKNPNFITKITNPTDQAMSYIITHAPRVFQQSVTNPSERAILKYIKTYPRASVNPNWTLTPRIQKILQLKDEYLKKNGVSRYKVDMNAIAKAAMQSEPKTYQPTNTSDNETIT